MIHGNSREGQTPLRDADAGGEVVVQIEITEAEGQCASGQDWPWLPGT